MGASTMVVHVGQRGKDMAGLMRYLYGPGKSNEHTDQHVIASGRDIGFAYEGPLAMAEASEFGRILEASWRREMADARALVGARGAGVGHDLMTSGAGVVSDAEKEHVYHVSLSLPPGESWTDEQWATVAADFVEGMGFTDGPDDDKGCRWAAVRHGLSAGGNDHVHIAINLVREDGRRAELPAVDYALANEVRRQIEAKRDFVLPLHDANRTRGASLPGYSMAEHAMAKQMVATVGGEPALAVPDRVLLQNVVRAAASSAATEAEWINTVLDAPGVELEGRRWASGGRETATGYAVRIGEEGRWFTGSQLAPDLTLEKMRRGWAANETPETRAHAAALWREDTDPSDTLAPAATSSLDGATENLTAWAAQLHAAHPADKDAWRAASRDAAGVMSVLAFADKAHAPQLINTAQTLSRHAVIAAAEHAAAPLPRASYGPTRAQLAARHIHLAIRAGAASNHPGWIAVLAQMRNTLNAIEDARRARGELVAARQLATAAAVLDTTRGDIHGRYGNLDEASIREIWETRTLTNGGHTRDTSAWLRPTADGHTGQVHHRSWEQGPTRSRRL